MISRCPRYMNDIATLVLYCKRRTLSAIQKAIKMHQAVKIGYSFSERLRAHLAIARLDHSIKNLFVLPGIIVPLSVSPELVNRRLVTTLLLAFVAITLVACSNYVINE